MLYKICVNVITSQDYVLNDMERKILKYKNANLITEQEYNELTQLMTDYPTKNV